MLFSVYADSYGLHGCAVACTVDTESVCSFLPSSLDAGDAPIVLLLTVYAWLECAVDCELFSARDAAGCGPSKKEVAGSGASESAARRGEAVMAGEDRALRLGVRDAIAIAIACASPGVQDFRQLHSETCKLRS